MANQSWPGSLPDTPDVDRNREVLPVNTVRTQMNKGPPKVRRRSTAQYDKRPYQWSNLTGSQADTFVSFYKTTTNFGALKFDMTDPRTNNTEEFRFVPQDEEPSVQNLGGDTWVARATLERTL